MAGRRDLVLHLEHEVLRLAFVEQDLAPDRRHLHIEDLRDALL